MRGCPMSFVFLGILKILIWKIDMIIVSNLNIKKKFDVNSKLYMILDVAYVMRKANVPIKN